MRKWRDKNLILYNLCPVTVFYGIQKKKKNKKEKKKKKEEEEKKSYIQFSTMLIRTIYNLIKGSETK